MSNPEIKKEKLLKKYPRPITYEQTEIILKKMRSNICLIKHEKTSGTGCFCKIPFPDKNNLIPVLITNNHIIGDEILNNPNEKIVISIKEENKTRKLNLNNRITYTNEKYDVTFIEIYPDKDDININNFLEFDENVLNDGSIEEYKGESIYIIHYPKEILSVSYGILDDIEINGNDFRHFCSTEDGSSGSPILNVKNNKLIGIHKETIRTYEFNTGVFLNNAIKEFVSKECNVLDGLNKKYNINIKSTRIKELDLPKVKIGNEGFEFICKIEFSELKKINLEKNDISNIDALKDLKNDKIKKLYLNDNKISDIAVLEKVKFESLETLNLNGNEISDIKVLENVKFPQLKKLGLGKNKIEDIKPLEKAKFPNISILDLNNNDISNIEIIFK